MTVLVTGFGSFAEHTDNPSGLLARAWNGRRLDDGEETIGVVLPVATERVGPALDDALAAARPRLVLALGLAPGRPAPALERIAVNVRDFPVPDIDGAQPVDVPVVPGGPDAYLADLPLKAILASWREAGLPGYISNTAGTYVCNQLFYLIAHHGRRAGFRAGLVHLPALPAAADAGLPVPSMSLQWMERTVHTALAVAAGHTGPDLPLAGGAVS